MSRVCQFKCTQGRTNVRIVGGVGKDEVDLIMFSDYWDHNFKEASTNKKKKNLANGWGTSLHKTRDLKF